MPSKLCSKNLKPISHLRGFSVDGRIILKGISKKSDVRMWNDSRGGRTVI
jgi:hypothetical protein